MSTIEELAAEIESVGVRRVSMRELRNACGWERLGTGVRRDAIPGRLRGVGLYWWPEEIPSRQDAEILLVVEGSFEHQLLSLRDLPIKQVEKLLFKCASNPCLNLPDSATLREDAAKKTKDAALSKEWVVRVRKPTKRS